MDNHLSYEEWQAVDEYLGFPGAMISGTKRKPQNREDHTIYWNACVFNQHGQQIWHGDLDVTLWELELQSLANRIGTVYVTPELPWRFDGFAKTSKDSYELKRVVTFEPETNASL